MKKIISIVTISILVACGNNEPSIIEDSVTLEENVTESISDTTNPLPEIQPPGLSPDQSWIVSMDIQEGFFLSYTIKYQNGEELTKKVDETLDIIGGIDFTSTKWIDDTTYYIPHIGGSTKGHWDLYIYKNGSCKYDEVITNSSK